MLPKQNQTWHVDPENMHSLRLIKASCSRLKAFRANVLHDVCAKKVHETVSFSLVSILCCSKRGLINLAIAVR